MKRAAKIITVLTLILYTLSNDCKSDIYGYRLEYYLDGKPIGGQGVSHADESKLSKKQNMKVVFDENDFPDESDISAFQIEIYVLDSNLNESGPTDIVEISAEYGKKYEISVSGSFEDGFKAEL